MRKSDKLEKHFIKNIKDYKKNSLIKEILKVKVIESKDKKVTLFYAIRDNYIGIYINGMSVKLELKEGDVWLTPTKSNPSENSPDLLELKEIFKNCNKEHIKTINQFKTAMVKYFETYSNYQAIKAMNEKIYQHILTHTINNFKSLKKDYGEINIIDAELYIYLTELKKRGDARGKIDLVGISSTGKLLYIEVKIDGPVILGNNGINKHCHDIKEYIEHGYSKEDVNTLIGQINFLFDKDIKLIKNEIPDFIIICGYHPSEKHEVIDQIAEITSKEMIKELKNYPKIVNVNNKPEELKTIHEHFQDLKDRRVVPRLLMAEVNDKYELITEYDINYITTKKYANKPFHYIRKSLLSYLKQHKQINENEK